MSRPTREDVEESPSLTIRDELDDTLTRYRARDRALVSSMTSGAIIRIVTAILSLGYFAVSVRALTHIQFGALATIATFTGFMAFADLGVGSGLMTQLAVAHGRSDRKVAQELVSCAWAAMLCLGLLAAIFGSLIASLLPWSRVLGMPPGYESEARHAVIGLSIAAGLAIPSNIGLRILMASQRGTVANIWMLFATGLTLGSISLASAIDAPLWGFVVALVGTPMMVALSQSAWVLLVVYPDLRPRRMLVTRNSLWSLGHVSSLFFALNLAVAFAYQCDMVIVAASLGAANAAVFAVGIRMFGVLTSVLSGGSQQLWTSMAEALARGDREWVKTRFLRAMTVTSGLAILASGVIVFLGRDLAEVWVGEDVVPSLSLLGLLAVWAVYSLAMTQVSFLLNAAQIIGPQMIMATGMATANFSLSLYLVGRIGMIGPVIGSLVSHLIFTGVPSLFFVRRILGQRSDPIGTEL